jgi:ABC-2 type transport system permease protein
MTDGIRRVRAIARKDIEEIRRQPAILLPVVALILALAAPAFIVTIFVPAVSGEDLADSDFARVIEQAGRLSPELARTPPAALAQTFLLQQFLIFGLMVPVLGSLSLAAQSIIGEKQSRALEPLLATPISTTELLIAKIATPFLLSMAMLAVTFLLYVGGMAVLGEPGVWRSLFWPRTLVLYGVLGPLVALTGLGMAAIVSSRVNDARSAQQLGGLVVLPMTGVFVAQLTGQFLLGVWALLMVAAGLVVVNGILLWVGVMVFQRETILMRWK